MSSCAFCPASDNLHACQWPVERFVPVTLADVRVGDEVCRFSDSGEKPIRAIVAELVWESPWVGRVTLIRNRRTGVSREKRFIGNHFMRIKVRSEVPCGTLACEQHVRDTGRWYCLEHWNAWEDPIQESRATGPRSPALAK